MKYLALALVLACSLPGRAEEVKFSGSAWDSLAIPLGIPAYYLSIDSPVKAKKLSIEMDLYKKGVFVRTITVGGMARDEAHAIRINAALYFPHKDIPKGKVSVNWEGMRAAENLDISPVDFPVAEGSGAGEFQSGITTPGRTAVFQLIAGAKNIKFTSVAEDTPKENPDASVLIGYLITE